jgi:ubiquinone/menaquinone biosynthesis C-methylase UbiE
MKVSTQLGNIDPQTVRGFGEEWGAFDQTQLKGSEYWKLFDQYFSVFPFDALPAEAEGFDLGCGSGRWAMGVLPRVGTLHCIDPSAEALAVARRRLGDRAGAKFHNSGVDEIPLADGSQDFGYSLGVLHHVPDTFAALRQCVAKLKPGAPFLVYLYYRFDNRPAWFVGLWRTTELVRKLVASAPFRIRKGLTDLIATSVYWPLARAAGILERFGVEVAHWPLSAYRYRSFYSMRTDALDRFGTRLEQRFTRAEIERMMEEAGLGDIRFRDGVPYWTACGVRQR